MKQRLKTTHGVGRVGAQKKRKAAVTHGTPGKKPKASSRKVCMGSKKKR